MEDTAYQQVLSALPLHIKRQADNLPERERAGVEELRLRVGQPLTAVCVRGELSLGGPAIQLRDLEQLVEVASRASLHAVLPQLCQGYLTIVGGHRIGLSGSVVMKGEEIGGFRSLSSANIRLARQFPGVSAPVLERLYSGERLASTLILAPPGLGKTTLLRDVVRMVSDGEGCLPLRVALADERGEVAACFGGQPQLNVGCRTDVVEGCPKARGLLLLLRAMNPQVLAADEITAPEDIAALELAAGCGVSLLATAHGSGRSDLMRRPLYRGLIESGIFERLVLIRRTEGMRSYMVEELS